MRLCVFSITQLIASEVTNHVSNETYVAHTRQIDCWHLPETSNLYFVTGVPQPPTHDAYLLQYCTLPIRHTCFSLSLEMSHITTKCN